MAHGGPLLIAGMMKALQVASLQLLILGALPESTRAKGLSTFSSVNSTTMLIVGYFIGSPNPRNAWSGTIG